MKHQNYDASAHDSDHILEARQVLLLFVSNDLEVQGLFSLCFGESPTIKSTLALSAFARAASSMVSSAESCVRDVPPRYSLTVRLDRV